MKTYMERNVLLSLLVLLVEPGASLVTTPTRALRHTSSWRPPPPAATRCSDFFCGKITIGRTLHWTRARIGATREGTNMCATSISTSNTLEDVSHEQDLGVGFDFGTRQVLCTSEDSYEDPVGRSFFSSKAIVVRVCVTFGPFSVLAVDAFSATIIYS